MVKRFKADDNKGYDAYITIAPVRTKKKETDSQKYWNHANKAHPDVAAKNSKLVEQMRKNKKKK